MTCPASLLTGLIEFWPFDEGGGVVAQGAKGVLDLDLKRGSRSIEGGWPAPGEDDGGGRVFYAGGGYGLLPGSVDPLADDADEAITIAIRYWPAAHRFCMDPVANQSGSHYFLSTGPSISSSTKRVQSRMVGVVASMNLSGGNWLGSSTLNNSGNWELFDVVTVPGVPVAADDIAPWLHVVVCRRTGAQTGEGDTWIDGVLVDQDTESSSPPDTEWGPAINMGDPRFEFAGGVVQAAIWGRALTSDEIEALGDSLDCVASLLEGDEPGAPLLNDDGTNRLRHEWPVERLAAPTAVGAPGPHRHTARTRQREIRRYGVVIRNASGAEIDIVRELLEDSAHGAKAVRWRSPDDAPGLVKDAPFYRLANPGELATSIRRLPGGGLGDVRLELETVH